MKHLLAALALLFIGSAFANAQSYHYRKGYVTKSGTYVAPSYATNPNSTRMDNWSTRGNYNPFTGKAGTKSPYSNSGSSGYRFRTR